jgi:hypothetical protein
VINNYADEKNHKTKKNIIFVNEFARWNLQYRADLMQALEFLGHKVENLGLRDKLFNFISFLCRDLSEIEIVSSNLRANLVVLICFPGNGTVIINGLGRHRRKKFFRAIFLFFSRKSKKKFVFQNYADFRWARRYLCEMVNWVPGSGGEGRAKGSDVQQVIVVTRENKIEVIWKSIQQFCGENPDKTVVIRGVSKLESGLKDKIIFSGFVKQEDLFFVGASFLQPDGYGEGFPQSLADAILSDLRIYISRSNYINYGLKRLGFRFISKTSTFGLLQGNKEARLSLSK